MRYLFDDYILDTEQLSLERQGQPVRLQPRVFQMLAYLLEQHHRVVPRQELFDQVWQGQYVSKSALDGCIKQARQAIGDSGRTQRLLKTQHGIGYRFVAPVTIEGTTDAEAEAAEQSSLEPAAEPPGVPPVTVSERRQLTVLSCTLADAPYLVSQLDPDDLHAVLRAFHALCADTTSPYGGRVAQRLDDHCLIYFGYPQAHDDDARRAVLAALKLLEAMRGGLPELGAWMEGTGGLKIGIHTGEVVIDGDTAPDTLVVGAATMQASALRDLAAPQTVVISSETARLVEGYVTRQALPPITLPGQRDAIPVYRVTGASGAQIRLDLVPTQRLTPFVGREAELALLDARWRQARDGRGQAVVVSGEAGIGKSRLVRMLAEQLVPDGCTAVEGRGSPYYQQSAFYPLSDVLRHVLHLDDHTDSIGQCEAVLQQYGMDAQRHLPFIAPFVNLTLPPERYETPQLTPQQRRQRTFESLTALVLALTEEQPLLLILEDLHWVDPSTLEWLEMLLDQTPTASVLLLMTCRPEFEVPWHTRSYLTQVTLDRLEAQHSRRMVESLIQDSDLPVPVVRQIVEHSDGVPLFVEELTRAVLDTGLETQIPTTLQDTLTARLDQVGAAKRTAQLGAVMGRQFEDALIRAVSPLNENDLHQDLRHLVDRELLYRRGVGEDTTYRFKHALIQDAASGSLLRRTRQQIHQQIAQVLETQFPETRETQPELIAHHFTEARQIEQAIPYWQQAGERAIERSANLEAIVHLQKGLELLNTLPDAAERPLQELMLQRRLGVSLLAAKGFGATEVASTYSRARELCRQVDDISHTFPVLYGLVGYHHLRQEWQTTRALAEEIFTLAQRLGEPGYLLMGHRAMGEVLYWTGEFVTARAHVEQGIAIYDADQHRAHAFVYGQDPLVNCQVLAAHVLWLLGYPDQALRMSEAAITWARQLGHPFSLAIALGNACQHRRIRQEWQVVLERAETLAALCAEHTFALWASHAVISKGWALAMTGNQEGIAQLRQVGADRRKIGAGNRHNGGLSAEIYRRIGQIEEGLRRVDKGLAISEETGECWAKADLHRLKGVLLLEKDNPDTAQAEACFHQALDIARQQQAKSWELRAATSLARLLQQQGKRQAAYGLLSPVYNWFTEGFDTADLQDAKNLLYELS